MTSNEIYKLIDQEIAWCKKNTRMVENEYRDGFIAGLKQAKRLIKGANKALEG